MRSNASAPKPQRAAILGSHRREQERDWLYSLIDEQLRALNAYPMTGTCTGCSGE